MIALKMKSFFGFMYYKPTTHNLLKAKGRSDRSIDKYRNLIIVLFTKNGLNVLKGYQYKTSKTKGLSFAILRLHTYYGTQHNTNMKTSWTFYQLLSIYNKLIIFAKLNLILKKLVFLMVGFNFISIFFLVWGKVLGCESLLDQKFKE